MCVLSVRGTAAWGLEVLIIPTCRCDWGSLWQRVCAVLGLCPGFAAYQV